MVLLSIITPLALFPFEEYEVMLFEATIPSIFDEVPVLQSIIQFLTVLWLQTAVLHILQMEIMPMV